MGCGTSSPTVHQAAKSREKDVVILTSEVSDSDFKSTEVQANKPTQRSNGTSQHSNGTMQQSKDTSQRETKPSEQHSANKSQDMNKNNGAAKVNSFYSKPRSVESATDDLMVENVEDLTGSDVKPKPSRKKKSQIISNPDMFKAVDSHVARVILENSPIYL
jgi:HSP90 family molecular chaperone